VITDVTAQYKQMEGDTLTTTLDHVVITTKAGLNLRASYNTTSTVLAVVPYNTTCVVVGTEPGWYEIVYGSIQGWVSANYVTFTPKVVPVKVAPVTPVSVVPTPTPTPGTASPIVTPVAPSVSSPTITIQSTDIQTLTQLNTLLNKILGGK